ncbi:MAG TPA: glycosyltransferase [Chloroflexota bacterium]|nr:glycosyltransferase [Chloroflexota bacterium]
MLQSVPTTAKAIDDYRAIVGEQRIDEICAQAAPLKGARVLHLNATAYGGGVSELLSALVPLMRSVGIEADWKLMVGAPELWDCTKAMHNLLQGACLIPGIPSRTLAAGGPDLGAPQIFPPLIEACWNDGMAEIWKRYNELTAREYEGDYDFVVVHDPQPVGMLDYLLRLRPGLGTTRFIWRCHIDLTNANQQIWEFLRPYLAPYHAAIFTMQDYVKSDIPVDLIELIAPAIDPLSTKNSDLSEDEVRTIVSKFGVDPSRPLLCQVSRFDPWKDPLGVIDVYRQVKREIPAVQLAMVGSMATDDPEAWRYYELTARHAGTDADVHILTNFLGVGNLEVNAFQRAADVVLQKSLREGFALTVSEALWKARPVVATAIGGIPLQVVSGHNGYLVHGNAECAQRVLELLRNSELARQFGLNAREHVRENFLVTRGLEDYLQLFGKLGRPMAVTPKAA